VCLLLLLQQSAKLLLNPLGGKAVEIYMDVQLRSVETKMIPEGVGFQSGVCSEAFLSLLSLSLSLSLSLCGLG
jgi:hypothetical protein